VCVCVCVCRRQHRTHACTACHAPTSHGISPPRGTGAGGDHGIDHHKNLVRFSYTMLHFCDPIISTRTHITIQSHPCRHHRVCCVRVPRACVRLAQAERDQQRLRAQIGGLKSSLAASREVGRAGRGVWCPHSARTLARFAHALRTRAHCAHARTPCAHARFAQRVRLPEAGAARRGGRRGAQATAAALCGGAVVAVAANSPSAAAAARAVAAGAMATPEKAPQRWHPPSAAAVGRSAPSKSPAR
jgi:hypothetical protein